LCRIGANRPRTAIKQVDRLFDCGHALLAFTEVARNLFPLRTEKMDANNAAIATACPPPSPARHGLDSGLLATERSRTGLADDQHRSTGTRPLTLVTFDGAAPNL
jgi:hypothetical protein